MKMKMKRKEKPKTSHPIPSSSALPFIIPSFNPLPLPLWATSYAFITPNPDQMASSQIF